MGTSLKDLEINNLTEKGVEKIVRGDFENLRGISLCNILFNQLIIKFIFKDVGILQDQIGRN